MTTLSTEKAPSSLPKINFTWSPVGAAVSYSIGGNSYPPAGTRFEAFYTPVNQLLTFVASAVLPTGVAITEWRWDMGDGNQKYGSTVSHTYVVPNPATSVRLEALDSLSRRVFVQKVLNLQVQFPTVVQDHLRV